MHCFRGDDEGSAGVMLNHVRSFAGVPKQGTQWAQIFTPQFGIIAPQNTGARQRMMDGSCQYSYRFDNVAMTESCRVEVGPLPLLGRGAWGKEPN
jgi:hypothetical protein